jgi:hypothetical protein
MDKSFSTNLVSAQFQIILFYLEVMLTVVLALSLVHFVHSACPCLANDGGVLNEYRNADNTISYRGFTYPANYGFGQCKQWDVDPTPLPPYCGDSQTGALLTDAPAFCQDSWCYIDPNNCDATLQYVSGVFPDSGLIYSSEACGNNGTYSDYFTTGSGYNLSDLADVVEDYVEKLARDLEFSILEKEFTSTCPYTGSCPCDSCAAAPNWNVDVDFTKTLLKPFHDDDSSVSVLSSCLSQDIDGFFSRVAGREYQNASEFATLYAGFQEDGVFMQWPAIDLCSPTYDPRFRPWYATAATNPKTVVMVIDVSGSMDAARIALAKESATAVLNTLTASDMVGIVLFNNAIRDTFDPVHVTDGNRTIIQTFINTQIYASGGTNFVQSLDAGFDMLESNHQCDSLLLFMTDGKANPGFALEADDYAAVHARSESLGAPIFTYALGASKLLLLQ